jgi:hypothetical protein
MKKVHEERHPPGSTAEPIPSVASYKRDIEVFAAKLASSYRADSAKDRAELSATVLRSAAEMARAVKRKARERVLADAE